jgi:hypothetical protein
MALGRDLGHYASYVMLDTYNPKAIFRQHRPFRPAIEATAAHCCWPTPHTRTRIDAMRRVQEAGAGEAGLETVMKVPTEFATVEDALAVVRDVKEIEVAGGKDISWSNIIYTNGSPIHPDLDMADLEPGAPMRRLSADRLPDLQPQINHMLQHPTANILKRLYLA